MTHVRESFGMFIVFIHHFTLTWRYIQLNAIESIIDNNNKYMLKQ